jgi:hypothetical protein
MHPWFFEFHIRSGGIEISSISSGICRRTERERSHHRSDNIFFSSMARPMILMLILESKQEKIVLVLNRYEEEQE